MPGTGPFVWHELRVPDLDEAARFYGAAFGWEFADNPMGRSITHRGVVIGGASAGAADEPVPLPGGAGYALAHDPQGVSFAVHTE